MDVLNDADAVAAGLARTHGKLDQLIRVWTLGTGIGYGRYPFSEGVWEGGHTVVTLDDKEHFCGCGGRGHLEGIMGHRAMRLRFLDMEPEEVFAAANTRGGDPRCVEFKHLWHKALAAATATSIHQAGPGKFFITGFNVRFLDLNMLKDYLHQMVKMSPLQSYSVEIVDDDHMTRVIGAAVAAEQAARSYLALALRAIYRRASAHHNLLERRAAIVALFTRAAVDLVLELKEACARHLHLRNPKPTTRPA